MKLRYKILNGFLIFLAVSIASLAILVSYTSDCGPASAPPAGPDTMKAVIYRCYGSADVLELANVEKPTPGDNAVLVKVRAAAVNPLDWHYMRGSPYIMRLDSGIGAPAQNRLGVDFAGVVESVGKNVTRFVPGDEVFGGRTGSFAEYVTVTADRALAHKPANISFAQAAAVPIAATTALQALRDSGRLQAGQKVLINGASGGVGTFAVQIAKSMGAEVTGVCSTRNVDMVRSIGADHVIDYTRENYTEMDHQFDLIVDNVGNHTPLDNRRVLAADGNYVIVGGGKGNWLAPLMGPLKAWLTSPFVEQDLQMMLAELRQDDLAFLAGLMESGRLTPVIDRTYALAEIAEAIRYSEGGRARGKIIIEVE